MVRLLPVDPPFAVAPILNPPFERSTAAGGFRRSVQITIWPLVLREQISFLRFSRGSMRTLNMFSPGFKLPRPLFKDRGRERFDCRLSRNSSAKFDPRIKHGSRLLEPPNGAEEHRNTLSPDRLEGPCLRPLSSLLVRRGRMKLFCLYVNESRWLVSLSADGGGDCTGCHRDLHLPRISAFYLVPEQAVLQPARSPVLVASGLGG